MIYFNNQCVFEKEDLMIKMLKLVSAAIAASLLLVPSLSHAQELTLRVEPGIAVPLTEPQSDRFKVGGAFAIKPELGLTPYLSIGPSISFLALPSSISGINTGTAWMFGGFGRLKRPHDASNTDTGLAAVSPWVDADLQYVYTNPLNRFGFAMAVGASVPTSDDRSLWVGPFVRYQGVVQGETVGYDSSNAKILIFGLSFEVGSKTEKKTESMPVVVVPSAPPCPQPPVIIEKPPVVILENVTVEESQVIQFAWDSPVIDADAETQLAEVLKKLLAAKSFESIKIEGHASSEGGVEHNNVLSKKRAQAVADYLVAHGVPKDKVTVTGFGSSVPVATNKTEEGRILNRRAEFVVKFVIVKEVK